MPGAEKTEILDANVPLHQKTFPNLANLDSWIHQSAFIKLLTKDEESETIGSTLPSSVALQTRAIVVLREMINKNQTDILYEEGALELPKKVN